MTSTVSSTGKLSRTTNGAVLVHIDFLLTGIVMTFLGPMLPIFSVRWNLNDEQAGYLSFAQFFSSMFGMFLSGVLVARLGYRTTFIIGLATMASGMTLLASGPWLLGIVAVCTLGFGHGITTPAGNLRTAEVNPQRSASALNVVNAVWGIGAMSSPFLVAMAQRAHRPDLFLYRTAIALLVLLVALLFVRFVPDIRREAKPADLKTRNMWNTGTLLLICALFFVYVGTETSFGVWIASYAERLDSGSRSLWAMTPAFFWGALLGGRLLAPFILKYYRETTVAKLGLSLALVGGFVVVWARGMGLLIPGSILAGVGLASIFPISVSLFPHWFGDSERNASSAVFASGNTGGAVLPWLVGTLSTHSGSLRFALVVPLLGAAAMLVFYVVEDVRRKRIPSVC
jgi:MFS transporter, FHS family, glucose/mannose:H+ symporter